MGAAKIVPEEHEGALYILRAELKKLTTLRDEWVKEGLYPEDVIRTVDRSFLGVQNTIELLEGKRNIKVDETTEDLTRRIMTGPRWDSCSPQIAKRFASVVVEVLD